MKNTVIQVVIAFILLFSACKDNPNEILISGRLENAKENTIVLKKILPNGVEAIDSLKLGLNGEFEFINEITSPSFLLFELDGERQIHLLVHPGDHIALFGDVKDIFNTYHIEGSPESLTIKQVNDKLNKVLYQIDSLGVVYRENLQNPRLDTVKAQLDSAYYKYTSEYKSYIVDYIKENPASLVNLMMFSQQFDDRNYVLSTKEDFVLFKMVDTTLYQLYPESDFVLSLHEKVNELEKLFKVIENNQKMLGSGVEAPEIDLKDYNGNDFLLSSLQGKIVILTFGASWSRESKNEMVYLDKAYELYQKHGLEIVQYSVERNKETWQNFIAKDSINWINVSDYKFWDSPVVNAYNVTSIPATFILDKQGKIITRNIRGEALIEELKKIFNK